MTRQLHIFVLIDALGWPYVEQHDFLRSELPYRKSLQTILGFSSGAIPTILTGERPEKNGHWNLFYYDPKNSPFWWLKAFRFLPASLLDNRIVRKTIKELGRRVLGLGPLFECCVRPSLLPWFNWVEKRSIYEPGGITGATSVFDRLEKAHTPYRVYSYHHYTDAEIFVEARRDILCRKADFLFLYLSELDNFLHFHCEDPEEVSKRLAFYEREINKLYSTALSADKNASLTVFSDHGMTPVREKVDLVSKIDALGFRMPDDYLAVYDSTMARFWFFNDRARTQIRESLKTLDCGQLLSDDELMRFGTYFPDRRFGEAIFLLDPGVLVAESDFNGRGWSPKGMHGYHPEDPYSDAVFLSSREPARDLRSIADIYHCLAAAGGMAT